MTRRRFGLHILAMTFAFMAALLALPFASVSEPWWSGSQIEETETPADHINYQRVLYQTPDGQPVRAHIVSVTSLGEDYIFGVLGSYGALVQPSVLARNSQAAVVVNGGFFSVNPTRALHFIMAHGKTLYPPPKSKKYQGTVGFFSEGVMIDRIGPDEILDGRFAPDNIPWSRCHAALGAGPLLVDDRDLLTGEFSESFNVEQKAPRTGIAVKEDESVLLVVVDGRQPEWSAGVTLPEFAELFGSLGAFDALNLDGGGSSTLIINNVIKNRPSDFAVPGQPGRERAVANVVALFKKTP